MPAGRRSAGGSREWFDRQAQQTGASSYFNHERDGYQIFRHDRILGRLSTKLGRTTCAVDLGCATGALTSRLGVTLDCSRLVGMDFVPAVLPRPGSGVDGHYAAAALPHVPLASECADLVILSEVLYYLSPEDRARALTEVERVLRPGGHVLITSSYGEGYFDEEGLIALLGQRFAVEGCWFDHCRLYHWLRAPIVRAGRLAARGATRRSVLGRASRLLGALVAGASMPFMRSTSIPALVDRTTALLGSRTRSNITVLARLTAKRA